METEKQGELIEAINAWQKSGEFHPLTCGVDSSHPNLVPIILNGRVCLECKECGYRQEIEGTPVGRIVLSVAPKAKKSSMEVRDWRIGGEAPMLNISGTWYGLEGWENGNVMCTAVNILNLVDMTVTVQQGTFKLVEAPVKKEAHLALV